MRGKSRFSRLVILALGIYQVSRVLASETSYQELSLKGIHAAYNLQIEEATAIFNELITLAPRNPHGHVLQSVNYFYRMQFEERGKDLEKQFKKHTSNAIKFARKLLLSKEHRADAMFYLGTTQMYLAAYHAEQNNWLRAYWSGKAGIDYLERVVAADSTYYDAYLGLGLYDYYADVMPRFLKTVTSVLGIKGDRRRGLQELRLAAEKGIYSKAEAIFFLINIHMEIEQDYAQALDYSRRLTTLYPNGFLFLHGEVLLQNGLHEQAIGVFKTAIVKYDEKHSPFFIIWSYYNLGNAYFEKNEFEQAILHCKQALQLIPKSSRNLKWVSDLCDLKIAESYDLLEKHDQAVTFYKRVEKSGHKQAYEVAQDRLKRPLSKEQIELIKGQNLVKSKHFEKAIAVYEQVLANMKLDTNAFSTKLIPEIHHNLGKTYYAKKEYENAISEFNKVLVHNDFQVEWLRPWTHYYLGKCYQEIGAFKEAKAEFEIAYEFDNRQLRFEIDKINELF